MDAGKLLPHDLVMDVVRERTANADCAEGYVLDGFPRTTEQAQMLEVVSSQRGHSVVAILVDLPQALLSTRIEGRCQCPLCGEIYNTFYRPPRREGFCDGHPNVELFRRQEDQVDKLKKRLEDFETLTVPVIGYYEKSGRLMRVDGTKSPDRVHDHVARYLSLS
jgi:adenylate kinase